MHDVSVENGDECVTVKAPTSGFAAENIQSFYSAGMVFPFRFAPWVDRKHMPGCNIGSFGENAMGVSFVSSRCDAFRQGLMPYLLIRVQNVYYRNVTQYRGDAGIFLKVKQGVAM